MLSYLIISNPASNHLFLYLLKACHIEERDKEGGRDLGRERDREEYYPRASGANYAAGRNDDGTAGSLGQEVRVFFYAASGNQCYGTAKVEAKLLCRLCHMSTYCS